ncbi:MAG TPA: hypothetical protein VIH58_07780 [Chthoniobacterales bacterium]|jgi:hypothetical protein
MVPLKTDPIPGYWINHTTENGARYHRASSSETRDRLFASCQARRATGSPAHILFEEFRRLKPSLDALGIGFSVSRAKGSNRGGKRRKPPYFACCYDAGSLAQVNVVAFYHPLIADWELMEADSDRYRQRVKSAVREEMIHAIQVLTAKKRYERSSELSSRFLDAETYYDHLLGRIIAELARNKVGEKAILTAAKLYYEDWTINSIEKLRQADRKYHGRDGYLICELIRQVTQIRFGEVMSEEAKGKAWDKQRIFFVGEYGTTENLMMAMAATLRQAVPQLIDLSPTLTEALTEIEATIQTIGGIAGAMLARSGGGAQPLLR